MTIEAAHSGPQTVLERATEPPESVVRLKAIAAGYLENRESFPFLTCRFLVAQGYAAGLQEALDRGPTTDTATAEGIWIVDGDRERYERRVKEVKVLGETEQGMSVALDPVQRLGEAEVVLSLSGILGGGGIYSRDEPPPPVEMTPWDMVDTMGAEGKLNPGGLISEWLGTKPGVVFRWEGVVEDRETSAELDKFTVEFLEDEWQVSYFIDVRRGCLPIEIAKQDNRGVFERGFITKVRECSKGRWFPERCVVVQPSRGDPSGACLVRELRVTELDVDNRPPESAFTIDIAAGTRVHDCIDPYSQITIPKTRSVRVTELSDLLATTRGAAVDRRAAEGSGGEPEPRPFMWWLLAANALFAVALLAAWIWQRRRHLRGQQQISSS